MTASPWQRVRCWFGGHSWLYNSPDVHVGTVRTCRGLWCQKPSQRLTLRGHDFVWMGVGSFDWPY